MKREAKRRSSAAHAIKSRTMATVHSGCCEYCSNDPPEKASFEVGDCSVNLGNVNFGCKAGEVGPSAFAHRLYNGFGLWPFEASGFQVAGCGERVKRDVHDVIILQFVSRLKVEFAIVAAAPGGCF